jgi:hypothetical protein
VSRRRLVVAVLGAVIGFSVAVGCGDRSSPSASTTRSASSAPNPTTALVRYTPFTPSGTIQSGLTVAESDAIADCDLSYLTKGAMRCFLGDEIRDPCYAERKRPPTRAVVCVYSPWDAEVTRARTPRGFVVRAAKVEGAVPWALELVDGFRCTELGGATTLVGNRRLNYGCVSPRKRTSHADLYGEPDKQRPRWTIYEARGSDVRAMRRVAIKTAWR